VLPPVSMMRSNSASSDMITTERLVRCLKMRQEPEFFGESELPLLYIAKKLKEALALEDLLTRAAIDYLVEPDTYRGGIIFASERVGAFFYVAPDRLTEARALLRANKYKPYDTR
jgi:hypothetical protein